MSFWEKLLGAVADTASNALSAVIEAIRTVFEGDPETRRKVAFSVAVIALSAKMAKADGVVTRDEVTAFEQLFDIPAAEHQNVARLFNLAKQDVAGFDAYARKLAGLFEPGSPVFEDIVAGLFHIAKADGAIHEKELAFIWRVAEIFGISESHFETITARHVHRDGIDPYVVLGVNRSDDFATIRKRYRVLVTEHHPDMLTARGMPEEFHAIANNRMATLNAAYEAIEKERRAA